ncbi:hypothetical protein STENM36S_06533 [Streptomyces tendae]
MSGPRRTGTGAGSRRAVVTGLGVVSPHGTGAEAHWKAVADGTSSLGPVTREGCADLPLRVAGEVRGFDAAETVEDRFLVQTDRFTHFALSATQHALADARFGRADVSSPYSVGVVTAAGSGGGEFGQRELQNLWGQGSRHVGPYQSIAWFYAASTGQVSIRNGFKGPCGVVAADEAGGLDALAHAALAVRRRGRPVCRRRAPTRPSASWAAPGVSGRLPTDVRRDEGTFGRERGPSARSWRTTADRVRWRAPPTSREDARRGPNHRPPGRPENRAGRCRGRSPSRRRRRRGPAGALLACLALGAVVLTAGAAVAYWRETRPR